MGADGADEIEPVVAQVRFTPDEGDLFDAELGHLADEIEGFCRVELVGPGAAGAGAAVATGEITAERDLPDGVNGANCGVDRADFRRERETSPGGEGVRRQREQPRAWSKL